MITIRGRNVNQNYGEALDSLLCIGEERPSRNGPVLAFPEPVATTYLNPTERVLFSPMRNANPTFHLMESLWMLTGRNDVKFPAEFVKNMRNFSDDGKTFWGAYGHRWRSFFGWDQLDAAIAELKNNPESRRVVVTMWNGMQGTTAHPGEIDPDFLVGQSGGKDVPCNTHIYFDRRDGNLNMTVCCRSNDIIWGCYGANVVHMSMLQEYMALSIGIPVGWYTQMSNDLHLYLERTKREDLIRLRDNAWVWDLYSKDMSKPTPLIQEGESILDFDDDLNLFFEAYDNKGIHAVLSEQFETQYFTGTVIPMLLAWLYRKTPTAAEEAVERIEAKDWHTTMSLWLRGQQAGVQK